MAPLRVSGFKSLAAAYTINELGDWLGSMALAILVYDKTGSALATALLFVATRFLPALVAPLIVACAEGLGPRRALPLLYGTGAAVYAALALIASGGFALASILVLGAADGSVALAARALTRSTATAALEPVGLLRRGNALFNIGFTATGALGPAIAGLVIAGAGASAALVADAISFGVAALFVASAGYPRGAARAGERWTRRITDAARYVRSRPLLANLLVAQALALVFFYAVVPIEVVYAKRTLSAGASGYGWLLTAWGVGMIAGGFVFVAAQAVRLQLMLALGTLAIGAAYLGLALAPTLWVACAVSVVGGIGNGVQWVSVVQAAQEATAAEMQARVLSLLEAIGAGLPVVGFLIGGLVTAAASPRTAYVTAGIGVIVVLAGAFVRLRRADWPERRELAVPAAQPPAAAPGHGPPAS